MSRITVLRFFGAAAALVVAVFATQSARADTYDVTLDGSSFWYEGLQNMDIELSINPGDTVRWTWVEGFHNVVSGFPEDPDTGELFFSGSPTDVPGTTFEFTFDVEPGVYGYHCHPHEAFGMISFVTVVPAPGSLALLPVAGLVCRRPRRRSCDASRP